LGCLGCFFLFQTGSFPRHPAFFEDSSAGPPRAPPFRSPLSRWRGGDCLSHLAGSFFSPQYLISSFPKDSFFLFSSSGTCPPPSGPSAPRRPGGSRFPPKTLVSLLGGDRNFFRSLSHPLFPFFFPGPFGRQYRIEISLRGRERRSPPGPSTTFLGLR